MISAVHHLRAAGSSIVLDARGTGVPALLHWGADLGVLSPAELESFADSLVPAVAPSSIDEPLRPTLLPALRDGWSSRPGLTGHGVTVAGSGPAGAGAVGLAPAALGLDHVDTLGDSALRVVLIPRDPAASPSSAHSGHPLRVEVHLELTEHGVLRIRTSVHNLGDTPFALDGVETGLPLPGRAREVLDFTGRWPRERQPQRRAVEHGTWLRESRHGRPGHDDAFVMVAGTPGFGFRSGEVWAAHLAWSGDKRLFVDAQATGWQTLGGGELLAPGEIVLEPGAGYQSPWLVAAWSTEGLDGLTARLHGYARAQAPTGPEPRKVMLNTWEAVYFDHDLDTLEALADAAAAVGVERFVLDDGWMLGRIDDRRALGDWVVDPDKWPAGLHPLIDHVTSLGMDFGLWVEPEMVSLDSEVARAHPEWVIGFDGSVPAAAPLSWRWQYALDLANPEAFEHVLGQLVALLREYPIAYLKWDQNRDLLGGSAHRQTTATYRLMDTLRERFPGLEIESCSSGGGRVDLGVMARTDRVWPSDTNDPLERQAIERWTSLLVPPEYFGAHLGAATAHTTGRTHALSFRLATALFGHAGVEWDLTRADVAERTSVAEWIAEYKRSRELLRTGTVVRADSVDPALWVHGVVAPDRREALFAVVTVAATREAVPAPVTFPGLDESVRYRVEPVLLGGGPRLIQDAPPPWWAEGGVVAAGRQLAVVGLPMPLLAPEQSLVLRLTALG
ncbi:alpha-galactosidase [Herbiconiux sp. P18]|uniref:alpha-galactosidase n=1 Tax=Herbiconiux liangxiaofengii TaxID=3342795 RepID=UPI0035B727A9